MIFRPFYLSCLAQASYLLASNGNAVVVDPQRDVDCYLDEAAQLGVRIKYVILTHLHADFVSGHRELAERTGAHIFIGTRADAEFPHIPVHDGDELAFGSCVLRFLETPGHTLESISILVTDRERGSEPFAVLTGDTLFVGDVGRPDLSNEASPQELAGMLYDSLAGKLLTLSDAVEVHPAHGAGSLCGRAMRAERSSTIGIERATNAALQAKDRAEFVRMLTSDLPARPAYFARDVEINRVGPRPLSRLVPAQPLDSMEVVCERACGAVVLDTRDEDAFGAGHVPGAINIGLGGQFATWAATIIGLDAEIIIVADDEQRVEESRLRLARVGIERVTGYLQGGVAAWWDAGLTLASVPQLSVDGLAELLSTDDRPPMNLVDVRRPLEWAAGYIPGAIHKPLDGLPAFATGLDPSRSVVVYCKAGYRSSLASSLLRRAGFHSVINVSGGFDAWLARELPYVGSAAA